MVLICAPSNGAIEELVSRIIKYGFTNKNNDIFNNNITIKPKLVRIGKNQSDNKLAENASLENIALYKFEKQFNEQINPIKLKIKNKKLLLNKFKVQNTAQNEMANEILQLDTLIKNKLKDSTKEIKKIEHQILTD